jgi:hypothetical protein
MCNDWQATRSGREVIIRFRVDASPDARPVFERIASLKMYGVWILSFRLEGEPKMAAAKRWFVHCLPDVPETVSTIALCINGVRAEFLTIHELGEDVACGAEREDVIAARERLVPALSGRAA